MEMTMKCRRLFCDEECWDHPEKGMLVLCQVHAEEVFRGERPAPPLRTCIDYQSVGRKTFLVGDLPDELFPTPELSPTLRDAVLPPIKLDRFSDKTLNLIRDLIAFGDADVSLDEYSVTIDFPPEAELKHQRRRLLSLLKRRQASLKAEALGALGDSLVDQFLEMKAIWGEGPAQEPRPRTLLLADVDDPSRVYRVPNRNNDAFPVRFPTVKPRLTPTQKLLGLLALGSMPVSPVRPDIPGFVGYIEPIHHPPPKPPDPRRPRRTSTAAKRRAEKKAKRHNR
jgi:hypothetical protein